MERLLHRGYKIRPVLCSRKSNDYGPAFKSLICDAFLRFEPMLIADATSDRVSNNFEKFASQIPEIKPKTSAEFFVHFKPQ